MEPTIKQEIQWAGIPLIVTVLFFGLLTGFQFGIHAFEFNGAKLDIHTFEPLLLTYFWITLVAFFAREYMFKFDRKSPIVILLIYNSLAIVTTILFCYTLLIASSIGGIIELFIGKGKSGSPLLGLLGYIKWATLILIPLLVCHEFFLIMRLKKLSSVG